jgi:hypothetical protein
MRPAYPSGVSATNDPSPDTRRALAGGERRPGLIPLEDKLAMIIPTHLRALAPDREARITHARKQNNATITANESTRDSIG